MKNVILRESALQKNKTEQLQETVSFPGRKCHYFTWNELLNPALKHKTLSHSLTYKGECGVILCIWVATSCHVKANGFGEMLMAIHG